ncbi:MAG: HEPN domain-containing protein [Candidatus Dormibacteria bacterium]
MPALRKTHYPRTHSGVIEAFRNYAVQSGRIDRNLGAELSRVESLRIKADYTGIEIEPKIAAEIVARAEVFVQTVERVFALDGSSLQTEYQDHDPDHDDRVSEPTGAGSRIESKDAHRQPISAEETRRQARENWLRLRQQEIEGTKCVGDDQDAGREAKEDRSHSFDDDPGE